MAVDDTGDDDLGWSVRVDSKKGWTTYRWNGDAIGDLPDDGAGGAQGGRGDVRTAIAVDDDGGDGVQGGICDLQQIQSLGVGVGVFQLRDEAEEGDVTSCAC